MTVSLVEHEIIKTTLIKAKELRGVAEPLITLAKKDSVANRRLAFNRLRNKATVGKLFTDLGPRYADRIAQKEWVRLPLVQSVQELRR